jgi:hypothetical protein
MKLALKPKFGSACNGCGVCCALELCGIAELAFPGAKAPCPALKLVSDGSRTYCQLIATEQTHNLDPIIQEILGVGVGCTMEDSF